MPREKDPFRDDVVFLQNNKWKCKFCNNEYRGSVTRIKAHLAGVRGHGINACKAVDDRTRSRAKKEFKAKGAAEPSNGAEANVEDPVNAEEGEPNTEVPRDSGTYDAPADSQPGTCGLVDPTLKRKLEELSSRAAAMDELETRSRKVKRINGEYWSIVQPFREGRFLAPRQVDRVDDLSKEVEEILSYCTFQKGSTTHATGCRKSSPLVTTKLVGYESEKTIKEICDYLMDDDIFIIGVYGMGGVGKTAILMHVHNRVLENSAFNDVFWITVPQEFSVCELQDEIANVVRLDNLSKDKDVKRRASMLNRHLKKKRAVLILDGLWMHFDFEDVGIPVEKGGIKLVLTTRSLNVCNEMLCQKQIKIKPLEPLEPIDEDGWSLFRVKLCFGRELPPEVEEIAKAIISKCGGLPLGIIEIATRMRGVEEVHEWKGMMRKLEESRVELNVFKKLKLSYVNLDDSQVQQCFLHLTQEFQEYEDFLRNKIELIESFIDEGLLDRMGTRQELYEQGNTVLDKLRKGCLCDEDEQDIYLHPLIRGMAWRIVRSTTHMVKAQMGLKEIPKKEFWTDHLEKVFLQGNDIEEISDGLSPNCPKLTRLSLNDNSSLKAIHESFFRHMKRLKVLDLSFTGLMELPDAICHLESLEALLLQGCDELCRIPCVRNLGSLRKLDVCECRMLGEVPEGMEMLVKLSYLDLSDTKIETLPGGVLGKLVNLQYLAIGKGMAWVRGKLKVVEGLYCFVSNVETFNTCVRFLEQNNSQPYKLLLNESGYHSSRDMHERHIIIKSCHSIAARVDGEIGGDDHALLPKNVQVLKVERCDGVTSLCEIGPLDNLKVLTIEVWEKLEELGAVHFPHLRRLNITGCSKLKHLLEEGQGLPHLQWFRIEGSEELEGINIVAPFLYSIEVYRCPKMKRVVEWEWRLPNLRSIKIGDCEKLEEIIGWGPAMPIGATCLLTDLELNGCNNMKGVLLTHDMLLRLPYLQDITVQDCKGIEVILGTVPDMTHPSFPNLIRLTLWNLPELKSICDGTASWVSFQYIDIKNCPKLKRLPLLDNGLSFPPPYLQSIWIDQLTWELLEYPPPSLWSILIDRLTWRSLEWSYLPFQSPLQQLVRFYGDFFNWQNQKMRMIIESCDSIVARVDGEIGRDGRKLLPENVQVLEVGRGSGVTSLSEVGPLEYLEELTIKQWEKLEELGPVHFPHLRELSITRCSKLKHLLVEGQGLPRLQSLYIEGSAELEGIKLAAPSLNHMEVSECPKMKRAVEWEWLATGLPNLWSIKIKNCEKLEEIIGGGPAVQIGARCLLTTLEITGCNNMKGVLLTPHTWLHLPFLHQISVEDCKGIEVIIGTLPNMTHSSVTNLTRLNLRNLPELKKICDGIMSCDSIRYYTIRNCPKLKRIPLQLSSLYSGVPSPPPSLREIRIDRQTWQTLEWEHPLGPFSLEPFTKVFS